MAKPKLSEKEKQERQEFLKNESIEDRTKRVIEPSVIKTLKQLDHLKRQLGSNRYSLTDEQKENVLEQLGNMLIGIENAMTKTSSKKDIEFTL